MEARGHAARDLDARDRPRLDVAGVEDPGLRAVVRDVGREGHAVAVVLLGGACAAREGGLAREPAARIVVDLARALVVVVLHQSLERQRLQVGGDQLVVGVAALHAVEVHVRQAELDVQVVELLLALLAGLHVHAPATQMALVAQVGEHRAERAFLGVAADGGVGLEAAVHHYPVAFLPGVDHVQHIARLELEPLDLLLRAVARDDAEAARQVAAELHHAMSGAAQHRGVVEQREVVQDGEARRDRRVMRQARSRQVDARLVAQRAVRADDIVGEPGLEVGVAVVDVLAGAHIDLAVRVEGGVDTAAEALLAARLERQRVDIVHVSGVVPGREQLAVVQVERGVRGVLAVVGVQRDILAARDPRHIVRTHDPGELDLAALDLVVQRAGLRPFADVARAAVTHVEAVDHAVAVEPVVLPLGFEHRVRSLAHVRAVEVVRHRSLHHAQIDGRDLGDHRRVWPVQIGVVDMVDPGRSVRGVLGADVGVLAHLWSPGRNRVRPRGRR